MYRKDHILTEIEKLTRALARLLGFKNNSQLPEAESLYNDTLINEYGLQPDELLKWSDDDFRQFIRQKKYSAEKLNILAQLLYFNATTELIMHPADIASLLQKTLIIFDLLERDYHIQSFENIGLQNKIQHLLQHHA